MRDRLPVIITLDVPRRGLVSRFEREDRIRERGARVLLDCPPDDFTLRHRFEYAAGLSGELHLRAVRRLLHNSGVRSIDLDGGGRGMLTETLALVGGYTANTAGFLGVGVTAATLDSGVDTDHTDLAAALVDEHCVCRPGCCPDGSNTQTGSGAAEDDNGHGSLVAGVLLSRGNSASVGTAPAANLVAVKVLRGSDLAFEATSDIIAALDWIVSNYTVLPPMASTVRVVNMSLVTNLRVTGDCDVHPSFSTLADVVDELDDRGVVVVAAAGNAGDTNQLPGPACLPKVVAVGAVWDSDLGIQNLQGLYGCTDFITAADQITCFSNAAINTDVFAPGAQMTGPINDGGVGVSVGTSFAAPAVAGAAALLLEQDPTRTPADVRALLVSSPSQVTGTPFTFPRLDVAFALGLGPDDDDSDFDGITLGAGDNCPAIPNSQQSDIEGDGVGDGCDLCPYVEDPDQTDTDMNGVGDACECIGPGFWPGDIDISGEVAVTDFDILAANFGHTGVTPVEGDQNCDDKVDGADYTLWADHLGRRSDEIDLSP